MKVCMLMREDIGCPGGWVHEGPAVRAPDQAEILGGPSFVLTNMQRAVYNLSRHPQVD